MTNTVTRVMIGIGMSVGTLLLMVGLLFTIVGIGSREVPAWIGIAIAYAGIHLELLSEIALMLWQDRQRQQPPPVTPESPGRRSLGR